MNPLKISCADGKQLQANHFTGKERARKLIVILPASATPQYFYRKFALYLHSKGYDVLTFDYRGIGGSADVAIDEEPASMSDWGSRDIEAVLNWSKEKYKTVFGIGHSVAGQVLPFASGNHLFSKVYLVASQNCSIRYWSGYRKYILLLFWYVVLPAALQWKGYLPGWAVGGKTDLPGNAAREWRSWGLSSHGAASSETARNLYESVDIDIHFVAIGDDKVFSPPASVQALHDQYSNARTSYECLEVRGQPIGHFGFFKSGNKERLWSLPLDYFENR